MSLIPGTRLGVYDITAQIGEGGMGQVFRATDTKLKRQVAIKILPPSLAADPERMARFQREAEVLASLNHPNIAHIHGLEESGGITALVMELVEGDDLSQRIARGAIPVEDALPIAKQIAEALEGAHEQGIIHRDLKPANIKVRSDGTVKVLDFGLAKAMEPAAGSSPSMSMSPTITTPAMTQAGMILGTAAYMSPEQAKGRAVDKRSDIWAFGAVLYEMLTGRRAFDGEDVSDTLAFVLTKEPDWTALPAVTPRSIRTLLRRCLEKDRKRRFDSAADARIEIEDAVNAPAGADPSVLIAHPHRNRERAAWALAAVALVAGAAGLAVAHWRPVPRDTAVVRFTIPPPSKVFVIDLGVPEIAISPDGRTVAFVAGVGVRQLWVRELDTLESRLMPGTDGAYRPFWSPDSRFIGFYAAGKMKKIALAGGSPQPICDVPEKPTIASGSWNRDGVIVLSRGAGGLVYRASAAGGQASPLTALKDKETGHSDVSFLPDGQHFLFLVSSAQADIAGVYVGSLDSSERKRILDPVGRTIYSAGHLLFVRDGRLMAEPFDPVRLETRGGPFLVADAVGSNGAYASMSVSDAGVLAYGSGSAVEIQLAWFDRSGRPLGTLGSPGRYGELRLSPDGQRVALVRNDPNRDNDLWLADLSSGILSRFTSNPGREHDPVWSPDGRQIAFYSNRKGSADIYLKTLGGGEETVLFEATGDQYVDDWTRDGRFIIFRNGSESAYALPMFGGDRKPVLLLKDPFLKDEFNVSPDGRWIAYNSDESERTQVYVAAFPSMTARHQVSNDGGGIPKWRRDGKELYYLSADGKLMTVAVTLTGTTIETGVPKTLFQTAISVALGQDQYDVTADGQKFLLLQPAEQASVPPITVVINWLAGVNRK